MASDAKLIKLIVFITTLIAGLGPLIYGLSLHSWDLASMVMPKYTPPLINFNVKYKDVRVVNKSITIMLVVENRGEIAVTLQDVNATLYDPNGAEIERVKLESPLYLEPYKVGRFNMTSDLESLAVKLIPYFKASNKVTLSAEGIILVKVFGTKAYAPFTIKIKISAEKLGLSMKQAYLKVNRTLRSDDLLKFVVKISNPALWKAVVEEVEAKLYGSDGVEISDLNLEKIVVIEPGSEGELTLIMQLNETVKAKLTQYIVEGENIFTLKGNVKASILELECKFPFEEKVVITRGELGV